MSDYQKQLDQLNRNMMNMAMKINATIRKKALRMVAIKVTSDAKALAPVDLGLLRRSINYRLEDEDGKMVALVGTNVEYAPFQEFGTSKMEAQPYLRPALDQNRPFIVEAIRQAIKEVTK